MSPRRPYDVVLPGGQALSFGARTLVMGVLNVTPDSFSDGGRFRGPEDAIQAARQMVLDGADVIDIGGESTRPGSEPVTADEECARVIPVLEGLKGLDVPLSIDTTKARVAEAAVAAGAAIINDVSGLQFDPELSSVAAASGTALILMHTRGRPSDMYGLAKYGSVVDDVAGELRSSIDRAVAAGVRRERLIVDPGLGFAKRAEDSLEVLAHIDAAPFVALDRPILVGPSRKSFLAAAMGAAPAADRDWATSAAATIAILGGAHMIRVHRVKELAQVAKVADAVLAHRQSRTAPAR